MSKFIDLDYAINQIEIGEKYKGGTFETDSERLRDFLKLIPSVEVVRCEHCKHFFDCSRNVSIVSDLVNESPIPDLEYCSRGERYEDNE